MTIADDVCDGMVGPFAAAWLATCAWCAGPPEPAGFNELPQRGYPFEREPLTAFLVEHLELEHGITEPLILNPLEVLRAAGAVEVLEALDELEEL